MWRMLALVSGLAVMLASLGSPTAASAMPAAARIPINDLASGTYLGFQGGLYPNGGNAMPASHRRAGVTRALRVRPLDTSGNPNVNGKYVLLSIGMSNTTMEWCSGSAGCSPWSFIGQAAADPQVNHSTLAIVDGAKGGQDADAWTAPGAANYNRIRDTKLAPRGLSEAQVQVVWVKLANATPTVSLPAADADAYRLVTQQGSVVRALKIRYQNLQLVFFSSRIYAGYARTQLNPEPYAYEGGFGVKWVIAAQITQMAGGPVDPRAGDLNYNRAAAWMAWGPYLWADGLNPRSDGLIWTQSDFNPDGTHPAQPGRQKVAAMLLSFFKTSPHTACWFLVIGTCT
jgi:hypothetical protein